MILQKITLNNSEYAEMYFRGGEYKDGCLYIKEGTRASFDTYFNCFSHSIYKKYTQIEEIELTLKIDGEATVQLCVFDGENETSLLSKDTKDGCVSLCVKIDNLKDEAILYPVVLAKSDVVLVGGEYSCRMNAINEINTAIVICTYKREQSVKDNLKILSSYKFSNIKRFLS